MENYSQKFLLSNAIFGCLKIYNSDRADSTQSSTSKLKFSVFFREITNQLSWKFQADRSCDKK